MTKSTTDTCLPMEKPASKAQPIAIVPSNYLYDMALYNAYMTAPPRSRQAAIPYHLRWFSLIFSDGTTGS